MIRTAPATLVLLVLPVFLALDPHSLEAQETVKDGPRIHYLEIVTSEPEQTCELLQAVHGVTFSEPVPELGTARVAELPDGNRIAVRGPLRADEAPVVRPYLLVDDIAAAIKTAEEAGGQVAIPPTEIPGHGTFALYLLGGIDHGLWQL